MPFVKGTFTVCKGHCHCKINKAMVNIQMGTIRPRQRPRGKEAMAVVAFQTQNPVDYMNQVTLGENLMKFVLLESRTDLQC